MELEKLEMEHQVNMIEDEVKSLKDKLAKTVDRGNQEIVTLMVRLSFKLDKSFLHISLHQCLHDLI